MPLVPNQLLASLPQADLDRLLSTSDEVPLVPAHVLCERGAPAEHVYFPIQGFISLVTQTDDHPGLEVGMVGDEGMLGAQRVLGVARSPWRALVQCQGAAWRVGAPAFCRELRRSAVLQQRLQRYVYVVLAQQALAAACIHDHLIGPRLARWLLMSHDRSHADRLQATHAVLASMLGVRRVGVTMAAGKFQRSGLIRYHRGALTVLDRPGLEEIACGCYLRQRRVYGEVMGRDVLAAWPEDSR